MKKIFALMLVTLLMTTVAVADDGFVGTFDKPFEVDYYAGTILPVDDTLTISVDNAEVGIFADDAFYIDESAKEGEVVFEVYGNIQNVPEVIIEEGSLQVAFGDEQSEHDAVVNVYLCGRLLRELFVVVGRGDIAVDSTAEYISVTTTNGSVEAHAHSASVEVDAPYLWCGSSIKNALTDLTWRDGEESVFETVFNPGAKSKQRIEISAGFEVAIE